MRREGNQRGMMLLELVVAAGITGMIATVLGAAIFHLLGVSERASDKLAAVRDIQTAGYWIQLDGGQAQATNLVDGADPVDTVTFTWTKEGELHTTTYSLLGSALQRNHNGEVITVAHHVSSVGFSVSGKVVTVTLTSSPSSRWGVAKSMSYRIWIRATL